MTKIVYSNIVGIIAGKREIPDFIQEGDELKLFRDPDNEYDKKAIKIKFLFDPGYRDLGFVGRAANPNTKFYIEEDGHRQDVKSDFQDYILKNGIREARVSQVFRDGDRVTGIHYLLIQDGEPAEVPYSYDGLTESLGKSEEVKKYRHYNEKGEMMELKPMSLQRRKDNKCYMSITSFLDLKMPVIGLEEWAAKTVTRNNLDDRAHIGTKVHQGIEAAFRFASDHDGWNLAMKEMEVITYNDELMIAGTFDALFEDSCGFTYLVDWKSGKINEKHRIQSAFYAKTYGADHARVVGVISDNAKKYSVSRVDIEEEYKKLLDLM